VKAISELLGATQAIEVGIVTLAQALHLPTGAALVLFVWGRVMSWSWRALEEYQALQLIRPRAHSVGSPLLAETAPLDSETTERSDEEPSPSKCYPFPKKPEHERRQLVSYRAFTHIALIVTPLRQAEEFYRTLFALEVAFREAETADGWYTLPSDASWDDAEAAGVSLGLCSLHRDAFTLALEAGSSSGGGRLSHIGVQVDAEELARLRVVAPTLGCQVVQDGQAILVFDDPYGVRWEMTTSSYEDPRRLSTGARKGLWLTIGQDRSS
jgi:catechol 2,3-dioxygenase-like lactoylglutathione lyase family enzyme